MDDKDLLQDILVSIKKVEIRLKKIQFDALEDKFAAIFSQDYRTLNDIYYNIIISIIQIYIVYIGYLYIRSISLELPTTAIGLIGIGVILLNAIFNLLRNGSLLLKIWSRHKKTSKYFKDIKKYLDSIDPQLNDYQKLKELDIDFEKFQEKMKKSLDDLNGKITDDESTTSKDLDIRAMERNP
jgi:hypothetical protein